MSSTSRRHRLAGQIVKPSPVSRPATSRWRRSLLLGGLLLALGGVVSAQEGPIPVQAEARSFQLGALHLTSLRDAALLVANDGHTFGLPAAAGSVAGVLTAAGAAGNGVRLDVDALLVQWPGHVVLLDSGFGAGSAMHGVLPQSLAKAGLSPSAVTDVLITHGHPDHIGGLLDGNGQLTFPRAWIHLSTAEWSAVQANPELHALVAVISPRVRTFTAGAEVLPGIRSVSLPGHTPGHVGYQISSQGQQLLDIGDSAHSSIVSLARPDWKLAWDSDKDLAVKTRKQWLQHLASSGELIFAPHFPYPGVGKIETAGSGYRFQGEVPVGK